MFIFVTKKSAIRIIEIEQQFKSKGNVPKIVFPNLLSWFRTTLASREAGGICKGAITEKKVIDSHSPGNCLQNTDMQ